ncbi:endolytic transglycosylase MltG [Breznakiellaceae bacterium SP9]
MCLLFVLVIGAVTIGYVRYLNDPPLTTPAIVSDAGLWIEGDELHIEVKNGESEASVGERLENARVIKSRYVWQLISRYEDDFIKAGTYRIALPASQWKIFSQLVDGRQVQVRVTIPEGATLKKTSRILADARICEADDFLEAAKRKEILGHYKVPGISMEGYLYPETYLFPPNYPAEQVVKRMVDTFFARITEIDPAVVQYSPQEIYEKVILASIIEREYRVTDEAAIMAGVFTNRLKIGMPLQSCATVEYIITEIQGKPHPEVLFNRDTEIDDPYNTYRRRGLPPGPISAPGETALKAAFMPAATDYLYFRLVDARAGRHYFSKTLDDHIQAGAIYVKW